jgi:hypothetical protein
MSQAYSVPSREKDPHSLPDVETLFMSQDELDNAEPGSVFSPEWNGGDTDFTAGWYYWPCFPGCLPDGDPSGPFATEQLAIADAQSEAWQFEDDDKPDLRCDQC